MGSQDESESLDGGLSQADIDAAMAALNNGSPDQALMSESDHGDLGQADGAPAPAGPGKVSGSVGRPVADGTDPPVMPAPGETRLDAAGNPFDEAAEAMAAAIEEERKRAVAPSPRAGEVPVQPVEMPDFSHAVEKSGCERRIDLLEDVELHVKIELGRSRMLVEDVLNLGEGSVVELDKLAGDPVDVLVNDRLVARGEVLVLNDNFCVRINEIVSQTGTAIRG